MELPRPPGSSRPINETPAPAEGVNENEVTFIMDRELRPEHRNDPNVLRFISNYINCRHPGQAAEEAGLDRRSGRNLLARPDIHNCIKALTTKSLMKFGFDADQIIERVKELADVDVTLLQREDGVGIENLRELPAEVRRAIKSFKIKNTYETDPNGIKHVSGKIIEVEFHDKVKSYELLGGEKDIFKKKTVTEHTVSTDMKEILLGSSRRAAERVQQMKDVTPQVTFTPKEPTDGEKEAP